MKRFIPYIIVIILTAVIVKFCSNSKENSASFEENTQLIEKSIKNVGKLVVTEGHFSQVITYRDQEKYLMDMLSFEKKALVIVNAQVSIAYDLHQLKYNIDEKNKTIELTYIPKEEINIDPQLTFYDVQQTTLSPFKGEDYNKVNKKVREDLLKKINQSKLKANAKNRLVSELSKILILTNSMGWTLEYNGNKIQTETDLSSKL